MTDAELLEAYVRERSETAFRALVERYGGLVQASAMRQAGEPPLAEDITQAVFALLARKAKSLPRGIVLSGWLFQTTRFVAARARRSEVRRRRREHEALAMQPLHHQPEPDLWAQVGPVIDDALARLRDTDRDAVLLRFVEGRSLREVGAALGISEEAAKKRVNRAVERLRLMLGRSGVAVTALALGSGLRAQAAPALDPAAIATVTSQALGTTAAGVSPALLVTQTLRSWRWARARWLAAAGALLLAPAWLLLQPVQHASVVRPADQAAPVSDPSAGRTEPRLAPVVDEGLDQRRALTLRVVNALTGEPIAQAPIYMKEWVERTIRTETAGTTDERGERRLRYSAHAGRLDIGVVAPGWSARYFTFPSEGQAGFPPVYTLRLGPVTNAVGGWIRDARGVGIAGVEVWFKGHETGDHAQRERPRERFGFNDPILGDRTDANGRWMFRSIASDHGALSFEARHPGFADTSVITVGAARLGVEPEAAERDLWAGRLLTTMQPAGSLDGIVRRADGTPIEGAVIQRSEQAPLFRTDRQGRFEVPNLALAPWPFTVSAEGFAPVRTSAVVTAVGAAPPVVITLATGAVMRVRLVDENGFEVPDALVVLDQWGTNRSALEWRVRTDFSGRVEWVSAPPDVAIQLDAYKEGYCYSRDLQARADGVERTFVLRHALELLGQVRDAKTGQPIPDFKVVPGYGPGDRFYDRAQRWYSGSMVRGTNGFFRLEFTERVQPWQVRISAEGYHEWISPALTNSVRDSIEVALQPARDDECVRGVVLDPAGQPQAGADVALLTFEHNVQLRGRTFAGTKPWITKTDPHGQFRFPASSAAHSVAAVGPSGYTHRRLTGPSEAVSLQLEPWGRVVGRVDPSAARLGVESIELYDPTTYNYQGRVDLLGTFSVRPKPDGTFAFEEVPRGQFKVWVNSRSGIPYHHGTAVRVEPGSTVEVLLADGPGARVTGRLAAPVQALDHLRASRSRSFSIVAEVPSAQRKAPVGTGADRLWKELEFWTSAEGWAQIEHPRTFSGILHDDGSFESTDPLPPGQYEMRFPIPRWGYVRHAFVVDEGAAELNLGQVPVETLR